MGWLDKNKNNSKTETHNPPVTASPVRTDSKSDAMGTIIGPGLEIVGHLKAEEDIYIAGKIKGEVTCGKKVTVAATGHVEGKVACHSIVVFGVVDGNVDATELITIEKTGKLKGDITTKVFTNQPGGFFEGYSHMIKKSESPKPEASATEEQPNETSKNKRKGS